HEPFPCLVTGAAGSGKSAAMARFVSDYRRQHPYALVVPHFIGASPQSSSVPALLRRLCRALSQRFDLGVDLPDEASGLARTVRRLLAKGPERARVLIVIDALDQLDDEDSPTALAWLPSQVPGHVKIVLSCAADTGPASALLETL